MIQEGDKVYCKNFDEYGLEDRLYTVIGVLDNIVWVNGIGFDVDFPECIFIKVNPFTIQGCSYCRDVIMFLLTKEKQDDEPIEKSC